MDSYDVKSVRLDQLILDPNNYRFKGEQDRPVVAEKRFADASVQKKAVERLRKDGLAELKQSILSNGFLPVERIVVKVHEHPSESQEDDRYVVLEGNRRVATLLWIKEDAETGAEVSEGVLEALHDIPVVQLSSDDPSSYLAIMGIRHVGGIREWGGYQSAKLVAELKSAHNLNTQEVASKLGLSAVEVNRRFKAFRALEGMRESEEYGDYVSADLYPLFHEALSAPKIRTWLGWSDESFEFIAEENREIFYSLLSPRRDDTQTLRPAKITTYSQVRELKLLIANEDAYESLLDLEKSFSDASALVKSADASREWPGKVRSAMSALNHMGLIESKQLSDTQVALLDDFNNLIAELLDANSSSKK